MSVAYKLEPFDINTLKEIDKRKKPGKYIRRHVIEIIDEFVAGNYDCCKVCSCENDRKAHVEVTVLRRSVKSSGHNNVKVVLRGNNVYLVKKDRWERNVQ